MEEIWKDIKGYENDYQVSNLGNVRCLHYGRKRQNPNRVGIRNLKLIKNSMGYYVVNLYKRENMEICLVHRLVAETFIPNPTNLPEVDHINTITTDNNIGNLRWCTHKENINNPISAKRRIEKCRKFLKGKFGKDSPKHKSVLQYTADGVFVREWECMSDAWRNLGIDSGGMTRVCKGKQKTAGGFIWKYKQ